jgi:hypothetical protein
MNVIEFQHFHGCPIGPPLMDRVYEAIMKSDYEIVFKGVIIVLLTKQGSIDSEALRL